MVTFTSHTPPLNLHLRPHCTCMPTSFSLKTFHPSAGVQGLLLRRCMCDWGTRINSDLSTQHFLRSTQHGALSSQRCFPCCCLRTGCVGGFGDGRRRDRTGHGSRSPRLWTCETRRGSLSPSASAMRRSVECNEVLLPNRRYSELVALWGKVHARCQGFWWDWRAKKRPKWASNWATNPFALTFLAYANGCCCCLSHFGHVSQRFPQRRKSLERGNPQQRWGEGVCSGSDL